MDAAVRSIANLLPPPWRVERVDEPHGDPGLDGRMDLVAADGLRTSFAIEAKRSGAVPIAYLLSQLREMRRMSPWPVLLISDYIGPSLRDALIGEGISFADATGWVYLASSEPLVLVVGQGAKRSPKSSGSTAVLRLNGVAATRIIRALTTINLPIGVRALAEVAGVSPGSVSKLLPTLAAEGVIDRDADGKVVTVRRRSLLRRWTRDYGFTTTNQSLGYFIAPRGVERTAARLESTKMPLALTGSAAARRRLPEGTTSVVPLRLLALYAADPVGLARELGLIEADAVTANVVIAAPQDSRIIAPPGEGGVPLAPTALILADLLTLPNRSDAEADQLFDVLVREDIAWKD